MIHMEQVGASSGVTGQRRETGAGTGTTAVAAVARTTTGWAIVALTRTSARADAGT